MELTSWEIVRRALLHDSLLFLTLPATADQVEDLVLSQLKWVAVGPGGLVIPETKDFEYYSSVL